MKEREREEGSFYENSPGNKELYNDTKEMTIPDSKKNETNIKNSLQMVRN